MNLRNIPAAGSHAIATVGDVLRVDLGLDSGFPNGRPIPNAVPNREGTDVHDVVLDVILSGGMSILSDGVDYNDRNYLTQFPGSRRRAKATRRATVLRRRDLGGADEVACQDGLLRATSPACAPTPRPGSR